MFLTAAFDLFHHIANGKPLEPLFPLPGIVATPQLELLQEPHQSYKPQSLDQGLNASLLNLMWRRLSMLSSLRQELITGGEEATEAR